MDQKKYISFGEYLLDETNEILWRGSQTISMRPKVFALLKFLLMHAGELVTKEQLLDALWPNTYVGDAVLKDSVREIRDVLRDNARKPKYIETAHRRGYRFIAPVSEPVSTKSSDSQNASPNAATDQTPVEDVPSPSTDHSVLGRDNAFSQLQEWFESSLKNDRQIVFVTGEPGIGKTTLVEAFVAKATAGADIWAARGQCLEQFGAGEPFLPVLDALSRLCRGPDQTRVIELLHKRAPTWLAQMPWIAATYHEVQMKQQLLGATRERMLREMAEALEALTAERPVVLVLEDLHWSDYSTLDLISYLARRSEPVRLMVIGTYRPVELILSDHPLKGVKQELQVHRLCKELPLEYLTRKTVRDFLELRFPNSPVAVELSQMIHQRTEGNPLFIVNLVNYLLAEKLVVEESGRWRLQADPGQVERGLPENIRHLIEKQIDRLSPQQQRILEAASVVGMSCSAVAIAAALDGDLLETEECCEEMSRRNQFLMPPYQAELPDGTITPRFTFIHVLYLDVLYNRISPTRRSQMHLRISKRGEEIYGQRVTEIASELAVHFDEGRDRSKAVKYYLMAAENAASRFANREGMALARRGLDLLSLLPKTNERATQEIALRLILGASLMTIRGFASDEVEKVYLPARELCEQQNAPLQLFKVLWSLRLFYMYRGDMQTAREIAERLLSQATDLNDTALKVEAHRALGSALLNAAEYTPALEQFERAVALYEPFHQDSYFLIHGNDAKVMSLSFEALLLWCLGYPDRSLVRLREALSFANEIAHTQTIVVALYVGARIHQLRREPAPAKRFAEEGTALANEHGMSTWATLCSIYSGWATAEEGDTKRGIDQMSTALDEYRSRGAKLWQGYFLGMLAEALGKAGRIQEGIEVISEALAGVRDTGERYYEAELHRINGDLLMAEIGQQEDLSSEYFTAAEKCLSHSLELARVQNTKSWELRAAVSLLRLHMKQKKRSEAKNLLAGVYSWFSEGYDTVDLTEARLLLGEFGDPSPWSANAADS
ncbi:MAG TPA: AAA family ATPase [Blastocatellia bacterium]|nr:AAA family ATPase [Blastocatellia bacterium]